MTTQRKAFELAKKDLGLKEIPGAEHEAKIVAYFAAVGHSWVKDDETAWCAAFVGAKLEDAGIPSTRKLNARSYLEWGEKVESFLAEPGDVVVFPRGKNPAQGHVGFFVSWEGDRVLILGGNQKNEVRIDSYPTDKILGVRRWASQERPQEPQEPSSATGVAGNPLAAVLSHIFGVFRSILERMSGKGS